MPKDEGLEQEAIKFIFRLYLLNNFIQITNNEVCIQTPQRDAHLDYQCLVPQWDAHLDYQHLVPQWDANLDNQCLVESIILLNFFLSYKRNLPSPFHVIFCLFILIEAFKLNFYIIFSHFIYQSISTPSLSPFPSTPQPTFPPLLKVGSQ